MDKFRLHLVGNVVAMSAAVTMVAYGHYVLNEITQTFVEDRRSEAEFFSELVRDNWDGITSVPEEKKRVLLRNLSPEVTGVDVETMGFFARLFLYLLGAALLIGRVLAIAKAVRSRAKRLPT
jgi:hypothetical protein